MSITVCIHCNTDSWFDITKKSTKIKFSNDKIYCDSYHRVPKYYKYVKSPTMI